MLQVLRKLSDKARQKKGQTVDELTKRAVDKVWDKCRQAAKKGNRSVGVYIDLPGFLTEDEANDVCDKVMAALVAGHVEADLTTPAVLRLNSGTLFFNVELSWEGDDEGG